MSDDKLDPSLTLASVAAPGLQAEFSLPWAAGFVDGDAEWGDACGFTFA